MKRYKTYIDEAGNTGDNLLDLKQPLFVLGAVSIPMEKHTQAELVREAHFLAVKEKEETEIKATKWYKAPKKREAIKLMLDELEKLGAEYHIVVVEKRFMISGWAVNTFFDYYNVGSDDMSFVNDAEKRKFVADHYEQNCPDEDLTVIGKALREPTRESYQSAIDALRRNAPEQSSKEILDCAERNVDRLLEVETEPNEMFAENVFHSPNLTGFATLGNLVAKMCLDEQGETALIFDDCNLCNEAFPKLFDIFKNVEEDIQIPGLPLIYTWKNRILSVQKGLSHAQPLLQAADVLATSTDKVLQKCREDNMNFNDYECGILMLLAILYGEGNLWMVSSQKLKQHFGKATRIVSQLD